MIIETYESLGEKSKFFDCLKLTLQKSFQAKLCVSKEVLIVNTAFQKFKNIS
jgi:hypothetical protein